MCNNTTTACNLKFPIFGILFDGNNMKVGAKYLKFRWRQIINISINTVLNIQSRKYGDGVKLSGYN
jgi:hypothetical protein